MRKLATYIITIERIEERLRDSIELRDSLVSMGLFDRIEILPAIYWKDETSILGFLSQNPKHTFSADYLDRCRMGQLCCTLSHLKAWKAVLDSHCDGAMIFEDDIYISDQEQFREIFRLLPAHVDMDWLRIHLHKSFRDEILQKGADLEFIDDPSHWGFAGYFVSCAGARKLLNSFHDIDDNIDHVIPALRKKGVLNCRTLNKLVVEHHPFDGNHKDLEGRHEIELWDIKMQKSASTIWTSPELTANKTVYRSVKALANVKELQEDGITVLRGVFEKKAISQLKKDVLEHRPLFKNTRPTPSSRHLAGFHLYPELEPVDKLLSGNPKILDFLNLVLEGKRVRTIGLSDITMNRSQCWHKDLLRGKYQSLLEFEDIWGVEGGGVYRVLLYLQDSSSLKIVKGSHLVPVALDSDRHCEPESDTDVVTVSVEQGDVAIMDIRTTHRGSPEHVFQSEEFTRNPRVLVATTLGVIDGRLTRAMEEGNARRLKDWQERNQ